MDHERDESTGKKRQVKEKINQRERERERERKRETSTGLMES